MYFDENTVKAIKWLAQPENQYLLNKNVVDDLLPALYEMLLGEKYPYFLRLENVETIRRLAAREAMQEKPPVFTGEKI